jgi:hypothetical protein
VRKECHVQRQRSEPWLGTPAMMTHGPGDDLSAGPYCFGPISLRVELEWLLPRFDKKSDWTLNCSGTGWPALDR